ncbi:hypothetical protein PG984_004045 [Apiospora sp. TS-2023a]
MTRSRGTRAGKGRKGPQKEAPDGQLSTKEPRRAQPQSKSNSNSRRVSLPPRPLPGHELPQARLQGADHRTNVSTQQFPQRPYGSDENDLSYHPPPSEPESFRRDHYLRNPVPSPIMPNRPHDARAGHGYVELPRDESLMTNPHVPLVAHSRVRPQDYYRQRTPEYYRSQSSEIIQGRPYFEGRGAPNSRLSSDVRHRHARSMSPVDGPARSSGHPALAVPSASVASTTQIGEPCSDHNQVGDKQRKEAQQTKCGNCKREGHEVKDCVSKIGATGCVMACPRCNSNKHLYAQCPSPHAPPVGTHEREEEDLYFLLTCRQNKPQIRAFTDLAALVRWTTPSLAAFPWTPAFALRYHADPQQAAAERDYDYSKHDFGLGGGGRRPDREALTRRFDPSHPVIPKIPVPTELMVPATPEEIESRQRNMPHGRPASVDTVMNDVNARAESMGFNSGANGPVATQQRTVDSFGSSDTTHTHTSPSAFTTVSPPIRGDNNTSSWAAPAPRSTVKDDGQMKRDLGTKGVSNSSKAAPTTTSSGGYSDTWEAYVAAEIERLERRKSLKKRSPKG